MSNFMKIRPEGTEIFPRMDIQIDTKKLRVAFRSYANAYQK